MPSSRDPWALMRTIPGVLVDRVNVAGSESGQQSQFASKGADPKDAVWSIDGIVTTDMAAVGSSADYYSYDAFDEVNFSTGGNSSEIQTGGLGVGIVTKRGTNAFHGNASGYFTNDDLQWSNIPDELVGDPRLQGSDKADHTEKITDMTFDLGGPVVKDKLWFYGSYGDNDISIRNINQTPDKTTLKAYSAKLNWQATGSDMVSRLLVPGRQAQGGPHRLVGRARAPRGHAVEPGQGVARAAARPHQGRVEPRVRSQLLPDRQGGPLQHGLQPGAAGRAGRGQVGAGQPGPGGPRHRLRLVLPAAAGHAGARRQLLHARLRRQPRAEVRRRLPRHRQLQPAHEPRHQGAGPLQHHLDARPLLPRRGQRHRGELPLGPPGRHLHARPADGEPGRALGQPEGQEGRVHHPGQPAHPDPAAGARLRGRRRHDDRVEQHLAPPRLHLRARRGAQDRAARLVRALRGPAAGGRRRLGQRARARPTSSTTGPTATATRSSR